MLAALFALTLFLSAALSFLVQPMVGKQLLPILGGTPNVWNTCLVFFQAMLLLGYFLAHQLAKSRRSLGQQIVVEVLILLSAGTLLVLGGLLKPDPAIIPTNSEMPILAVLTLLLTMVGAPFLALSMTAPLLQKWFARSGRDPYPLYAASNLGSFVGLLSYPLVIEPNLRVDDQRLMWAIGFIAAMTLILACGLISFRKPAIANPTDPVPLTVGISTRQIMKWIGLAALPSSLLMSVTTYLTTDIAPIPLLWVVPLSLYLLSFVIVFARWPDTARRRIGRITPMFLCFLAVALLMRANQPMVMVGTIHLATFFCAALLCHGELAAERPPTEKLTTFYLSLSVGGVLGGLVNTFLAPFLFAQAGNLEYPIALVLVALVRPPLGTMCIHWKRSDGIWPFALGLMTAVLVVGVPWVFGPKPIDETDAMIDRLVRGGISFGIPAAMAFALVWRPVRFALCLAVVLAVGSLAPNSHGKILEIERNYFGTLRVTLSEDGRFHRIVHGTTLHGQQALPTTERPDPQTYYHRRGPFGRLMNKLPAEKYQRVGVVGLGCGATAAYALPGQHWTFYEIDPAVVRIAQDTRYFNFLSLCPAEVDIVLGDARRQLQKAPDGSFDLLVLDAFSSDAIPVHLLTREAFEMYLAKLKPQGLLTLHLSNRYLDLPSEVRRVLAAINPQLIGKVEEDSPTDEGRADGQTGSTWMIVARNEADLQSYANTWTKIAPTPGPVWTDDFSNLLGAWKTEE